MKYQLKKQNGFTLIELIITVAIIGILSSIALPSYNKSVMKGKRVDAKVELLRIAQIQESYFVQNLSYATDLTTNAGGLGLVASGNVTSEQGLYTIALAATKSDGTTACTGLPANACTMFTLTASPVSGESQANDVACGGLRIDNVGRKQAIGDAVTSYGTGSAQITKSRECWN